MILEGNGGSQFIYSIVDKESNLLGYLAMDSTINGCSYGGLRMVPSLSPKTLAQAARVMTLKHGFLGLPLGGAKAAIIADPEAPLEEKRRLLKNFGESLMPFLKTRSYVPGGEFGLSDDDIRFMLIANGLKVQPRSLTGRSGFYTGLTVFTAAISAARHIGLDLSRASVAIEGFGKVGSSVALSFWERNMRVVAISTIQGAIYREEGLDVGQLNILYNQVGSKAVQAYQGAQQIEKNKLLELEVDLLAPCAGHYSIDADNAGRVAAKIICPGANIPTTSEAEQILFQRGILSLPDFVANCGGALGTSMEFAGLGEGCIRQFVEQRFGRKVDEVLAAAEKVNMIPREYAERVAWEKFRGVKERAEKVTLANKAFSAALSLHRNRVIPEFVVGRLSAKYFREKLG